jgi:small-conductance mechanosensitive channel
MRARIVFIVLALLVVGGVAAMNWPDFSRTTPMSFGLFTTEGSVGLFMLAAFGLTLLVMLLSSAMQESRFMLESHRQAKALQAQRDLADKAEASRFTDLRQHLDMHLRENRQREAIAATEFEKAMVQSQRELRAQLEQMSRSLDTRLAELQGRIDGRLDRVQPVLDVPPRPLDVPPRASDLPPRERERL